MVVRLSTRGNIEAIKGIMSEKRDQTPLEEPDASEQKVEVVDDSSENESCADEYQR